MNAPAPSDQPKYEAIYAAERHALGAPGKAIVAAIQACGPAPLDILDLGCGQGRDALFMARLGHRVVAVDVAKSGLDQLAGDAETEALPIVTVLADLVSHQPSQDFDVILADRTFHMLRPADRVSVLARMLNHANPGAWVIIADEKRNLAALRAVFEQHGADWNEVSQKVGMLIMRRSAV